MCVAQRMSAVSCAWSCSPSIPVQPLAHHQTCASVLTAPSPLLSTNPCCSISHLPLPPFHRLNLPQPLQYPFLAGFPCTGACSNVQLHRKPLFTNQLPQVKPTVTRSFFFLQIFWQTNPKLWKSKEGCHKMCRWLQGDRRKDYLNIADYTFYIS